MSKNINKLVCVMSCRNRGTRLFGKPMQVLNIKKNITIIEHLIDCLKKINSVSEVALAISYGDENTTELVAKAKQVASKITVD